MKKTILGALAFLTLIATPQNAAAGALVDKINSSDVIAVGDITEVRGTTRDIQFGLAIKHVLKGLVDASTIQVEFSKAQADPRSAPFAVTQQCGLFFLQQRAGKWQVEPLEANPRALPDLFYPSTGCAMTTADNPRGGDGPVEETIREVLRSVESVPYDDRLVLRLLHNVSVRESGQFADAARRFSQSPLQQVKTLGLAWRLALGDPSAMREIADSSATLGNIGRALASVIAECTPEDAESIRYLGSMMTATPVSGFAYAASFALRHIHTTATLPYLVRALDSGDAGVRGNAVAGLSMYMLEVPVLRSSDDRQAMFEHSINPAYRKHLAADDDAHIAFVLPADSAAEAHLLQWWKARGSQILATLPPGK